MSREIACFWRAEVLFQDFCLNEMCVSGNKKDPIIFLYYLHRIVSVMFEPIPKL